MKSAKLLSACLALALPVTALAQPADESANTDANANAPAADAGAATNAASMPDENQMPPGGYPADVNGGMAPDQSQGQPGQGQSQPDQSAPPAAGQAPPARPRATVILPRRGSSATGEGADASAFEPPTNAVAGGARELRLNFRNAPIEMVLNYLSDAAGFIIELDTRISGRVDVWSNQPVTRNEAVELLNSVLNRNGYAVVRNGRTLRVMTKDEAIHSDIPVRVSNDPNTIPKTDEIVTQIIPVRFVEAKQLIADLSPLVSSRATIIANEAGNSLIVTDTQANIHHLVEVIQAIDSSAEDVTEVRVFHLQYHDPNEVATLLTTLFSSQGNAGNQTPIRFGGFGGGGGGGGFRGGFIARMMAAQGGGGGAAGAGNGGAANDRIKKHSQVTAVADQRTQSVVVTAAKDLMEQISDMIAQLDQQESTKVAHVSVIHLENADPQQVQQVLQDVFQSGNAARRGTTQNSALMNRMQQNQNGSSSVFGNGGGGNGGGGNGFGGGGGYRGGGGFGQ